MDYKDNEAGITDDLFYFKGKADLIKTLLNKHCVGENLKILSIGCGTGEDLSVINEIGNHYVLDIEKEALKSVSDNQCVGKILCDCTSISIKDKSFDVVLALDVLEHIENDSMATSEIYRVLKPDGLIVVTVPAFQFLFGPHDTYLEHKRRYTKPTLGRLFNNFSKIKMGYWMSFLFPIALVSRIISKGSSKKNDMSKLPALINNLFTFILKIENKFIKIGMPLTWGLTIWAVYMKPKEGKN